MEKIGFNVVKKTLGFKLGPKELRCCMEKKQFEHQDNCNFCPSSSLEHDIGITLFGLPHISHMT
jgi:hypothetical protein